MALPCGFPSTANVIPNWWPSLNYGKTWLATIDAYIGCRYGHMFISNGQITKNLVLYPLAEPSPSLKPSVCKKPLPKEEFESENEELRLVLTIGHAL